MSRTAVIVGAGLAGALLAIYLSRDGWKVRHFERRADPRRAGYSGGRSINLALSHRGFWGLEGVGLDGEIRRSEAIPMKGRAVHAVDGSLVFQPYSSNPGDAINSVSRASLNLAIIRAAAGEPNVDLVFQTTCIDVDLDEPAAVFQRADGTIERVRADLIIGADGAFSAVRTRLMKTDRFQYSQQYLEHGYKELHIPPAAEVGVDPGTYGGWAMRPDALHIWPRGGAMMIALPNRDRSFTCTLFWPFRGEHGLDEPRTPEQVLEHFRRHYADAVPLMPTLASDYAANPVGSLVTVRCWPWRWADRCVLLGDAAHAIVPFYGQGMNAAFEDVRILAECLRTHADRGHALEAYQSSRKPNADAIADMALDNFIEMRDKVGHPEFLHRKRIEQTLHLLFPDRAEPQYNLVSFSTVPYVEAKRRGDRLAAVVDRVAERLPLNASTTLGERAWIEAVRAIGGPLLLADHEPDGPAGLPAPRTLIFDLTPTLSERTAVWPGDTPLTRQVLLDMGQGANITLSTLKATVHLGAHADAPNHYTHPAPGIDRAPLDRYLGPCHVLTVRANPGSRITPADFSPPLSPGRLRHSRVLIRTGTFPDPERWTESFAALSVELVNLLASLGVRTIGIDTPSVDLFSSRDLPAHRAIAAHGLSILEGLVLEGLPPGSGPHADEYELIALPLPLAGFDASPVRAVLRPLE
jgi:kynurenine 3-monooxygenase